MAPCSPLRTPLYDVQKSLGAKFISFADWELPLQFRGLVAEHHSVRERAGLFDVSHMCRFRVTGSRAVFAVDRLITNSLERTPNQRAIYSCCCNERGTILDDLICYRESDESVFVICNASNRLKILDHFARELGNTVALSDLSFDTGLLALQGPCSLGILEGITGSWVHSLPKMAFRQATVCGTSTTIANTGYTGELGVEIVCDSKDLGKLYSFILEAGRDHGIEPTGLGCRDTLRLEARLSLYGNEIDESTNPFEAGLGWTVKLEKADFIGKVSLLEARRTGIVRTLVGLEMLGHGIARHGYPVLNSNGAPIGQVTSGAPSPTLGKNIALAYVPLESAVVGAHLLVDCRGKWVDGRVVPTPFYRRARPTR